MFTAIQKAKNKKGFTLVELLIVLAIIAILAAIAIPAYSAQLEKARERVDLANERAALSMAVADYMLEDPENSSAVTYYFRYNKDEKSIEIARNGDGDLITEASGITAYGTAKGNKGKIIKVVVTEGEGNSSWVAGKTS